MDTVHGNLRFSCEHCSYTAKRKGMVKAHQQTHANIRYLCDQCVFYARRKDALQLHKETVHEGKDPQTVKEDSSQETEDQHRLV